MQISSTRNQLVIEDDETTIARLVRINEHWPNLFQEYLHMLIRNRERQLERIEVTNEIRARRATQSKQIQSKQLSDSQDLEDRNE